MGSLSPSLIAQLITRYPLAWFPPTGLVLYGFLSNPIVVHLYKVELGRCSRSFTHPRFPRSAQATPAALARTYHKPRV